MPRTLGAKLWTTYEGEKDNPQNVEIHESEEAADLRLLIDSSRKKVEMRSDLAKILSEIPFKLDRAEIYTPETLAEFQQRKNIPENEIYWITYRIAKGQEAEGTISRPGYFQFHKTLYEAIQAATLRTAKSGALGENYKFGILFKIKDERIFNGGKREGDFNLGAPLKDEEKKLNKRWAFFLSLPLLERFLEYEEKHPEMKRAKVLRQLINRALQADRLLRLPILAEEGLNVKTHGQFAHRVTEAEDEKLKVIQKQYKANKQDFLNRLIYTGLMMEGMKDPRGYPKHDPSELKK